MKNRTIAAFIAVLFVFALSAYGESTKTVTTKNTFGGTTYQTDYVPGDKSFDEYFVAKTIAYYDPDNNIKQADYFFTPEFGTNKGYIQKSEFYGPDQKAIQGVYYYTPFYAEKKGYFRSTDNYDKKGKVTRQEFEYNEKFANESGYDRSATVLFQGFIKQWEYNYIESFAKKIGYTKRIDHYVTLPNGDNKVTKQTFYDKDGKEINKPE